MPVIGQRISVIGTTGAGKTTMARMISRRLGLPHVELDALFWGPDWTPVGEELFRERVQAAVAGERWVVDGNYSRLRPVIWSRAQTVVILDYPFGLVFLQLMRRTLRRSLNREVLWSGNRESLSKSFFSRDSIILWLLQSFARKRRQFDQVMAQPEYAHLNFIRLHSTREANQWLEGLS